MLRTTTLLLALAAVPGCILYTGDDDPCTDYGGGSGGADIAAVELRNPQTGQCDYYYGGGGGTGGGSGTTCGDWGGDPAEPAPAPEPAPDWAMCYGACDGLDEATCLATSGCRAAYVSDCPAGVDCDSTTLSYHACFGTAPSGPVQGGGCAELDAYDCSRHDDCVAQHHAASAPAGGDGAEAPEYVADIGEFYACAAEPGTDGVPGYCYAPVACDALPPECPDGTLPGIADGCYTGFCVPVDECGDAPSCAGLAEAECVAAATCTPLYQGADCSCQGDACTCADWQFSRCSESGY